MGDPSGPPLDAGAYIMTIESEGITESVKVWRTDVVARIANGLGLEHVMFEVADPEVFSWYIKNYSPGVNLLWITVTSSNLSVFAPG